MSVLDLHIHTTISGDSIITPEVLFREAKKAGLDGVCITEHGYEKSRIAADLSWRYSFPFFAGLEASTELGDILVFGIDSYPRSISRAREFREFVEKAGGVLVAAHPFRSNFNRLSSSPAASDIAANHKYQLLELVDAMEVINGWSSEAEVVHCQKVSKELSLNGTGGSDAHIPAQVGCCVTVFESVIRSEAELVAELKQGKFKAEDRRLPEQKGALNWFRRT
ncbi:MAG: PHP domain-containing protein [Syntrophales bacterium]|nr:PHP domain-containing protein [Syntrophales bacterium]